MKANQTGLSLLEFTLVVIIVGVLLVVFLQRMVDLRVDIERTAVERTEAALRTALHIRLAELVVDDRRDEIAALEGSNALELLAAEPVLDGAVTDVDPDADATTIGPGDWSYDAATGEIVYRPRYADALPGDDPEGRWRVVARGDNGTALELEVTRAIDWP